MTETSAYWLARAIAALIGIVALLSWCGLRIRAHQTH